MWSRPESDEALMKRLLPSTNPDRAERACAWAEWQSSVGESSVLKFIRTNNNTGETDEDILQDAMFTAFLEVERGNYQPRQGVPFTAYVKGIARNKIREARRRGRYLVGLDEVAVRPLDLGERQLEISIEHREQHRMLHAGLSMLPGQRRQVLERYLHGESTSEIAGSLEITQDLVRQHKHRGLKSLREVVSSRV